MSDALLADLADVLAVARGDQRTTDERECEGGKVVEGRGGEHGCFPEKG